MKFTQISFCSLQRTGRESPLRKRWDERPADCFVVAKKCLDKRLNILVFLYVVFYNIHMEKQYRRKNTSVSMINYHLVFCPRYRRKIFLIDGLEARFKELVVQICKQNQFDILALECQIDHCHLFVNVPPDISAARVVQIIKANTARVLLKEFSTLSRMPNLWTRSYFASTAGDVSSETIKRYIEMQKNR